MNRYFLVFFKCDYYRDGNTLISTENGKFLNANECTKFIYEQVDKFNSETVVTSSNIVITNILEITESDYNEWCKAR